MKSIKKWKKVWGVVIFGLFLYGCGTAADSGSQEPIPGNGNADTVDGYHASNTPAPNTILVLNDEAKLPADITGDANTLDGHDSNDFLLRSIYDKNGDGKIDSDAITTGQIPWSSITGMPAGFADGIDDIGGDMFKATYDTDNNNKVDTADSIPWSGITGMPAGFADGVDDIGGDMFKATYDTDNNNKVDTADSIPWSSITGMPAGFADGIDDIGGDMFKATYDTDNNNIVDTADSIPWSGITGMPAGFADGVDNDTTYSAGTGLNLTGTTFSVDQPTLDGWYVNEGQIASISSSMISDGAIVDADISASAGIDPSKINGTAWTSLNDGSGSGLDADLLDGYESSYFLDTSATDQTKAGGLYVNFLTSVTAVWAGYFNIDSSSITIDSDGTNMQFNDNAGTKVYTLSELAGWQGFSNRIKILPGDFITTCSTYTAALHPDGGSVSSNVSDGCDLVATYNIPNGFRATEVMVYGNATRSLAVYSCSIDSIGCTQVSPAAGCTVGNLCNITDVNSTDTNYLSIYIDTLSNTYIYGGYITISRY